MAKQAFAEEADINNIMQRYAETGLLPSGTLQHQFGDFTQAEDYDTLLNRVIEAQEQFMELPSSIRDRFANSPAELFKFMQDPANEDEAVRLGLIPGPEPEPPKVEPPAPEPEE